MNRKDFTVESLGIVDGTRAGRPAEIPLSVWRYIWLDGNIRILLFVTLIFLFFGIGWILEKGYYVAGGICTVIGVLALLLLWKITRTRRLVYRHGLLVPGIVMASHPPRVLCVTNMSAFGGTPRYALKTVSEKHLPKEYAAPGSELPCVACFSGEGDDGYWDDFLPQPLCIGCGDKAVLEDRKARIEPGEFADLKALAAARITPDGDGKLRILHPSQVTWDDSTDDDLAADGEPLLSPPMAGLARVPPPIPDKFRQPPPLVPPPIPDKSGQP